MASVTPTVGLDWYADRATKSDFNEYRDMIAVGIGTTAPSLSDTQLENEEYRASKSSSNISVERTSVTGEIRCTVTVTGGTEVTAGSEITEIGLLSSGGTLLYREVRSSAVTVESGETQAMEFKVTMMD